MSAPVRPDWLVARPIAHRGLHDRGAGPAIENSPAAARAAVSRGFAIECDVQISRDGEAMVFHDFTLERLTVETGRVDERDSASLRDLPLRGGPDTIPSLPDYLTLIAGRVPLVCEIKSRFDGDMRIAERAAACAAAYEGPMCLESFDPRVITHLRANRTSLGISHVPLGMIAQADYSDPGDEWAGLDANEKHALAHFLHFTETRPDFLSYGVRDLPHAVPFLCRAGIAMPVTTWTVRTTAQRHLARRYADQIVFEGDIADGD